MKYPTKTIINTLTKINPIDKIRLKLFLFELETISKNPNYINNYLIKNRIIEINKKINNIVLESKKID